MNRDCLSVKDGSDLELIKEVINDKVNSPSHYTIGKIEVIDYINDKLTKEEYAGYCLGNVIKYVSRYRHKNGVEDLEKARVYLNWLIEVVSDEGGNNG